MAWRLNKYLAIYLLILAVALMISWFFLTKEKLLFVKDYHSPDSSMVVEVYSKDSIIRHFSPGSSSQREGWVKLRLNYSREIVFEAYCKNVGLIEDVWWEKDCIIIRGFDVWPYPNGKARTSASKND